MTMLNTTMIREDLKEPQLALTLGRLQKTAFSLFWQGVAFSQHGILRHRWRINKWSDQWLCAKALAPVCWDKNWNILDVGGAASLPVFHLALEGCTITTIDEDPELTEAAGKFSESKSLALAVLEKSLLQNDISETAQADWVLCLCCLENHTIDNQLKLCKKLGSLLKPGGILTITFQYGEESPLPHAPHNTRAIEEWVAATGLTYMNEQKFTDRQKRYPLYGRQPEREFTYGSVFLKK